jgi:hypothetical protein
MNSQRVVEMIAQLTKRLAKEFSFFPYTEEDIGQEIALHVIEYNKRYPDRDIVEDEIYDHVRMRLCGWKRDKYERKDQTNI